MIRGLSRRIVEGNGYQVAEAENGTEALDRCRVEMPDLIIVDWNMPVMGGLEFVTNLRATPGGDHPLVVFCTTEDGDDFIRKGIGAGANGYIVKPFDQTTMTAVLQRVGAV